MSPPPPLSAPSRPLNVLICGGGCAGPALAFWLARLGHRVTVVERHPELRASGAQIDIRAQGIEVIKRMGLLEALRAKLVDEAGVALVDSEGTVRATVLANTSGQGSQSLTSEYEIMRGDFVRLLYDATRESVRYVFGKTVESFEQVEGEDGNGGEGASNGGGGGASFVSVCFSDGRTGRFDMLVGADGQNSRIRRAILPPDEDPLRRLGLYMAYWFVPKAADDTNVRRVYLAPGRRMIMCRNHSPTESQAYFTLCADEVDDRNDKTSNDGSSKQSDEVSTNPRAISTLPLAEQKAFWAGRFRDAGWQAERFIAAMPTTPNFYSHEVVQVRTPTWSRGRSVVLLADAAHCPSPMSGMGTTSALVGAYVLAGEIARECNRKRDNDQGSRSEGGEGGSGAGTGDLAAAFANYDRVLRPFVDELQKLNPSLLKLGFPQSALGVRVVQTVASVVTYLGIPGFISRWMPANKGGWTLPEYPELTAVMGR